MNTCRLLLLTVCVTVAAGTLMSGEQLVIDVLCDPGTVAVRSAMAVFMKMWAAWGQGLLESPVGLAPSPWVCGELDPPSPLLPACRAHSGIGNILPQDSWQGQAGAFLSQN